MRHPAKRFHEHFCLGTLCHRESLANCCTIGDGTTDDTVAINNAIADGGRCGKGCDSSTITPALVYFPAGTYLVTKPVVAMYYSQLVGDPLNMPTIKGAPSFQGIGIIDSDPYEPDGRSVFQAFPI